MREGDPVSRIQVAINWLLWHFAVDFSLEKLCALAALGWGLSVAAFRPLQTSPGWHYLIWMVSWLPVPADWVWGPLLVWVGVRQFILSLHTWSLLPRRADAARLTGSIFLFFTFALLLGKTGTTGIPVYGLLAWSGFAASYQLTVRDRARRSP